MFLGKILKFNTDISQVSHLLHFKHISGVIVVNLAFGFGLHLLHKFVGVDFLKNLIRYVCNDTLSLSFSLSAASFFSFASATFSFRICWISGSMMMFSFMGIGKGLSFVSKSTKCFLAYSSAFFKISFFDFT